MRDGASFLRAIADTPDDQELRLIYADWLEDHDQGACAEILRLEDDWRRETPPVLNREFFDSLTRDPQELSPATSLRCWWPKLPPAEHRYPPILRTLSEKAAKVDLEWLAAVSQIGFEIRRLIERFADRVPLAPASSGCVRLASTRKAVDTLGAMFDRTVGSATARTRFLMPIDYLLFVATTAGIACPEEYGMSFFDRLFDAEQMAQWTERDCETYFEDLAKQEPDPQPMLATCGLWLFAGYEDKHHLHVCSDSGKSLFGVVADQHDTHPWLRVSLHPSVRTLSEPGPASHEVITRSFLDYLRLQVAEAEQR